MSQANQMAIQSFDQAAPLKYFNQYYYCTVIHVLRQHVNRHKQKIKNNLSNSFIIQDEDTFETFLTMLVSDRFLFSEYLKNNYLQHHFILPHLQIWFASNWFSFTKYYQFHMLLLSHIAIK